jgi:poly-beta-1,6-N-acetyl-D-glucosamine synthase
LQTALEVLLVFVAFYPVVTAALWIAGGVMFKLIDERGAEKVPPGGWPGVTVLLPAYNEEALIATSVRAALESDYPELEVLVLDDGSADETAAAARRTADGDPRCEVVRDEVNRGKEQCK